MTALLLDEMLSGAIARQLHAHLDVVAVVDDRGLVGTPDEDLLAHAVTQQRVLVTANISDFSVIAGDWRAAGREHFGIVYVASRAFPQNRSFVGAVVSALNATRVSGGFPSPGAEAFLRRD